MKNAYPNFSAEGLNAKPSYNLSKWIMAMREIYANLHVGKTFKDAFAIITHNWDIVEKKDFSVWLEYYQGNNHHKYTKVANFYVNDIPGYLLPNPKNVPSPIVPAQLNDPTDIVKNDFQEKLEQKEKRLKIENQRKKIIGRLHAAIKHLTSYEGQMLTGDEYDRLLTSMYELLRQFQTVNKVSLSNQLYCDLIIRQANKLNKVGYNKSASFLLKFAQNTPGKFDFPQGPLPIASQNSNGVAGSLSNDTPPLSALAPSPVKSEEKDENNPLHELLENLETAGLTDSNLNEDEEDEADEKDDLIFDLDIDLDVDLDDDLMVNAQVAPSNNLPKAAPISPKPLEDLSDVSLDAENAEDERIHADTRVEKNIDAILDNALSNITIEDIINKIEDVNSIFQNRTIARELSIIDLMLSTLGLSSYFNNLSEIIQKNHEASNYSISRLSDILTKLRGAAVNTQIDLNKEQEISPNMQQVQRNLQSQKDKEEARREMRKKIEEEEINSELTPPSNTLENPDVIQTPVETAPLKQVPPGNQINQIPANIV